MRTVSRVRLPEIPKSLLHDDTAGGRSALQGHPALRAPGYQNALHLPSIASAAHETFLQRSANAEPQDEEALEQEQGTEDSDIEKEDNNREDLIQVGFGYKLYEPPRPNGPGADGVEEGADAL